MKKKLLALTLSLSMLGSMLTACGSGSESAKQPAADAPASTAADGAAAGGNEYQGIPLTSEDVTLTVWESTSGADTFIKEAGRAFNKLYPNINIEFVNVELGDAAGQIALDGPAGVGPDLFAAPNHTSNVLVPSGLVLPSPQQDYLKEKLTDGSVTAITYDEQLYGVPIASEGYAVFYNRALISDDEIPATFEDLVKWSADFEAANPGKYGFLMNVTEGYYTQTFCTISPEKRLFGEFGTDGTVTNLNDEACVENFAWMVENLRPVMNIAAADIDQNTLQKTFVDGNAAMFVTGLWDVSTFQEAEIDFGVTTFPTLPGSDVIPEVFSSARVIYTSAFTAHPDEANAFALFLISDEMQQLRYELCGSSPTTSVEVESDYITGFAEQMGHSFPTPVIQQMDAYWEAMNSASQNIWDSKLTGSELRDFIRNELTVANDTILAG